MEMKNLKTRPLDFDKTFHYVFNNIKNTNELSNAILSQVNFHLGRFFTLLPDDAALHRIHEFSYGNMISQSSNLKKKYNISGVGDIWGVEVINIDHELANFVLEFLKQKGSNIAVLDDFLVRTDDSNIGIKGVETLFDNKEVYYLLIKNNSQEEVLQAIKQSCYAWHFLAVLTRSSDPISQILTNENLKSICTNIQYVIVGAYDGEGYIFWEKSV